MKLAYFLMADAVTPGTDGKLNLLGVGIGTLTASGVPLPASFGFAIRLEFTEAEVGVYEYELSLQTPSGTKKLAAGSSTVAITQPYVPELPLGANFQGTLVYSFSEFGLHHLVFRFGRRRYRYPFVVQQGELGT